MRITGVAAATAAPVRPRGIRITGVAASRGRRGAPGWHDSAMTSAFRGWPASARRPAAGLACLALTGFALLAGCSGGAPPGAPGSGPPGGPAAQTDPRVESGEPGGSPSPGAAGPPAPPAPVLLAAGDIGSCDSRGDEATAALLDRLPGSIATLGDQAYPDGSAADFRACYAPSWGRHRARTRPAAGNHEYHGGNAAPYFAYFGAAAGDASRGYYSYDLGAWHVVVVNSNCSAVGGCQAGAPQERWLRVDLAAHPAACTLAYWHHPLFTSGAEHVGLTAMRPVFQALYDAGAEIVLSGHNHNYERFAPQTPQGVADPTRGIRQFVVGTGGASHYRFGPAMPNSEVRDGTAYGVLRLVLRERGYDWRFVPAEGAAFTDSGTGSCH
jgi:hypothetical protein